MSGIAHYRLVAGEIEMAPAAAGECFPWLRVLEGKRFLCVLEGGAFHVFEISLAGVGRLGAEAAEILWQEARG